MSKKRGNTQKGFNKPKNKSVNNSKKTKLYLTIFVCIFVGIALIFGATLGIIAGVKNANSLIYFEGIGIDEGVTSYLVSYYKAQYMKNLSSGGVAVSDTPEFWNTKVFENNTHLDYLRVGTESYLCQLISANKIFEEYTSLSSDDKKELKVATEEILAYRAQGSTATFGELCEKYGFDYSDFVTATEMIYKGWAAKTKIFGDEGEKMTLFPEYTKEFYERYAHASLFFVRTEEVFELDAEGNRVSDGEGNDKLRPLTDAERAERERRLAEIRPAIAGINEGTTAPEMYYELLSKYDEGDSSSHTSGYYFMRDAEYTKEFSEVFSEIVEAVYELEVGKAAEIACDIGICFIYKTPLAEGAYSNTEDGWCFSDFNDLAADALYQELIEDYSDLVELRDKWVAWCGEKLISIPYNTDYVARF